MTKSELKGKLDLASWDFPEDGVAAQSHHELLESLQSALDDIRKDAPALRDFDPVVDQVMTAFQADPWGLFRLFVDGRRFKTSIAATSLHVSLVSFLFADANGWNPTDTKHLVRATLLHDVGMLFLPPELLSKAGRYTEQERVLLESHPLISFERTRRWGESYESTQVAFQHHEEWNGTGYPSRLSKDAIHPWARIVALAVNFVAKVSEREYRPSLIGYQAMKKLIQDQGTRFDPVVVKDFVRSLGLYPPGSVLLLSDGSVGRVLSLSHGTLLRPRVRILVDAFGKDFRDDRGPVLDLNEGSQVFISRAIHFQDILEAREHQTPG